MSQVLNVPPFFIGARELINSMLLNLLSVFRRDAGAQTEKELVEARTPCGVPSSLEWNYVRCQPTPQVTCQISLLRDWFESIQRLNLAVRGAPGDFSPPPFRAHKFNLSAPIICPQ
jgi:hypothetical protein